MPVYTPDDLMAGSVPAGDIVLYDDDHYYMGGVLAELLVEAGASVTLVTPCAYVSDWTNNTLEQASIHRRLVELGVKIQLNRDLESVADDHVVTDCVYTGRTETLPAAGVVLVTSRSTNDGLWRDLQARQQDWSDAGIRSVRVFGDAQAPGPIAWATYAGHRYARELDMPDIGDAVPFRREITRLSPD
jgi:dimethylamine/trimethylamine dehydrogenase